MFTGIVEEVGTIDTISRGANSAVLIIRAEKVLAGTKVGDSIAVNGICLTVTRLMPHAFTADVMHETLNRFIACKCDERSTCQFGACDGSRWQIRRAHSVGTC